jgi:hypothetical protein
VLTLLDIAGAVIGFVFTSQTSPRYFKGIYFVLAFTIMSMGCTTILVSLDGYRFSADTSVKFFGNRYKNAQKDKQIAAGAADDDSLGDENPYYKFTL